MPGYLSWGPALPILDSRVLGAGGRAEDFRPDAGLEPGAFHAGGPWTLGRLQSCLKRMESTGAITQPAPAPFLVTRGPCGCSTAPGWSAGGVLLPSLFQPSWVLLYLVLVSPIFTVGEKRSNQVLDV